MATTEPTPRSPGERPTLAEVVEVAGVEQWSLPLRLIPDAKGTVVHLGDEAGKLLGTFVDRPTADLARVAIEHVLALVADDA